MSASRERRARMDETANAADSARNAGGTKTVASSGLYYRNASPQRLKAKFISTEPRSTCLLDIHTSRYTFNPSTGGFFLSDVGFCAAI